MGPCAHRAWMGAASTLRTVLQKRGEARSIRILILFVSHWVIKELYKALTLALVETCVSVGICVCELMPNVAAATANAVSLMRWQVQRETFGNATTLFYTCFIFCSFFSWFALNSVSFTPQCFPYILKSQGKQSSFPLIKCVRSKMFGEEQVSTL